MRLRLRCLGARRLPIWLLVLRLLRRHLLQNRSTGMRIELHGEQGMLGAFSCEDGFAGGAAAANCETMGLACFPRVDPDPIYNCEDSLTWRQRRQHS